MNERRAAAERTFYFDDQRRFAAVSGDHNPVHLDAAVARRTQAGAPVVHGVHLLLWAMDTLAAAVGRPPPVRKLRVRFSKFVYVGETVDVQLTDQTSRLAKLRMTVNGTPVAQIVIEFGEPSNLRDSTEGTLQLLTQPQTPREIAFEAIANYSGRLPFATPPAQVAALFPAAAAWVGARRLAALIASTNLVGMVCPGLHSLFGALSVEMRADSNPEDVLRFRVTSTDPRFRLVCIAITGGDLVGTIDSFARLPPAPQATMTALVGAVSPTEFVGSTVLVVGGSRGIGELTAKLVATGGARTIITYQAGKADAEKVACEIAAFGGVCELMAYDARLPAQPQLANLANTPTHLYYFATPVISRRQSEMYTRPRLDEFLLLYVDGFRQLVQSLHGQRPNLSVFYPSSVFVDERPRGMTEYAMAKAAGEVLCNDMNDTLAPLRISVRRLPRVATDQTATLTASDTCPALEAMLPCVCEVQSWPKADA